MNYFPQSRNGTYLVAALLGVILVSVPLGAMASPGFIPGGKQVNVINNTPGTAFKADSRNTTGSAQFNFVGVGGNDTFVLMAGNASTIFLATGIHNNLFNISSGGGNSTFSLSSGSNSTFRIIQGNLNGSHSAQSFAITGGSNSILNESSAGPVGTSIYSVNLGTNSTVDLASEFAGNSSVINIVF